MLIWFSFKYVNMSNTFSRWVIVFLKVTGNKLKYFKQWVFLLFGTFCVGAGISGMIISESGASPFDAFLASLSLRSGFTIGSIMIVFSLVFVTVAWILGTKPGVGTVVSFLGIGFVVDFGLRFIPLFASFDNLLLGFLMWVVSFIVFAFGVVLLFSSGLGASPYDQIVMASANRLSVSIGKSRLFLDSAFVVSAFLVVGLPVFAFVNIGTILILVLTPIALNKGVPVFEKFIQS